MSPAHRLIFENLTGFSDEIPDRAASLDPNKGVSKKHAQKRARCERGLQGAYQADPRQQSLKYMKRAEGSMMPDT